jgi:hypothetical protein
LAPTLTHKKAAGDLICMFLAMLEVVRLEDESPGATLELFGATEGVRLQNLDPGGGVCRIASPLWGPLAAKSSPTFHSPVTPYSQIEPSVGVFPNNAIFR